jgi:hypothetical protein
MRALSVVALAALVTSCASAPRYSYRPTAETLREDAPGAVDGNAAADYPVPRNQPQGDVQVAAVGVAQRRLHVRMVVRNSGDEPWTVDGFEQKAVVDGNRRQEPAMAICDGQEMPLAVLMPGDTRTVDLYYELPPRLTGAAAIPSVRVDWRVRTPSGVLERQTSAFERHELVPPRAPVTPAAPRRIARAEAAGWPSWRP